MTANAGRSAWLERLAVIAILLAGLCLRARDLCAPLDREFEGAQAAFFAIGAVNYERLGLLRAGGYPVVNIDLGPPGDRARDLRNHPQSWYVYANHPPLVPLLAWASIQAGAPRGWSRAWEENRAPAGIEPWIRAPFLAAGVLGLFALWWALRQAAGPRRALLALAIASALPISAVYGTLVNYELPSLVCILAAVGFYARWVRDPGRRSLAACALALAAGSAVTYSALFFLPPLALHAWWRRGWRGALRFTTIAGLAALLPVAAHAVWSGWALRRLGLDPQPLTERALELWEPLLDGSRTPGEWASLQLERVGAWFTWPIALTATAGLLIAAIAAARALARRGAPENDATEIDLEPALLAGGGLFLFASYRHTLDPQYTFLLLLVPAVAGLAAFALDRAAVGLARLRLGSAPIALAVVALAFFALGRTNDLRFDLRALPGESRAGRSAHSLPLPDVTGAELAELVPAGGFAVHPAGVGLNAAVSFYAWRSLWPATGPGDTLPAAVAQHFGLGAAPRVLLLPREPWPAVASEIEALKTAWVMDLAPDRESKNWRAWDLH